MLNDAASRPLQLCGARRTGYTIKRNARRAVVSWIDNLIHDIPAASHYRQELEALQKENASLKHENAQLKADLQVFKERTSSADRLNGEIEQILLYILRQEYANPAAIAQALSFSTNVVDMYIHDLVKGGYLDSSYAGGGGAEYYLNQKAKRYLHSVGLL